MTDTIFHIVMTIVWISNAVMFLRLGCILYRRRRYSDEARVVRFNRAFERFKCQ